MDYLDDYDEPSWFGRIILAMVTYCSMAILGILSLIMGGIVCLVILLTFGMMAHVVP
jgi:hypothetical protein